MGGDRQERVSFQGLEFTIETVTYIPSVVRLFETCGSSLTLDGVFQTLSLRLPRRTVALKVIYVPGTHVQ